jgi:PAS domain S-box-containing protein
VCAPLLAQGRPFGAIACLRAGGAEAGGAEAGGAEAGNAALLEGLAALLAPAVDAGRLRGELAAARREREQTAALLDTFFTAAPVGFAVYDTDLRYVRVNPALAELNGLPAAAHVGRRPTEVLRPPEAAAQVEALLGQVLQSGQPLLDVRLRGERPGEPGSGRYWAGATYPIRSAGGELLGIGVVVSDVTDLHRAEQALERHAAELVRSNRELEQFAYVASHDLREPLRAITGFARLLAQRLAGLDGGADPQVSEYLEFITGGAARMQALIDGLLGYARASHQPLQRRPVDLGRLVAGCLSTLAAVIAERGAQVRVGPLPTVAADEAQLARVLQNLLANAVKFCAEPKPQVEVGAEREAGGWRIWVADNGIGIDPAQAERVFQMFQRLHDRRAYPGTGIGLAVCQRIVERHGGRIWFEPRPGGGTEFAFTLPDAPA